MHDLIAPLGTDADRRVQLAARCGLSGAHLYIAPLMEQRGADAYVVARLLWDPNVDPRPVREQYYRDLYGPGWRHIRRLYDLAEQKWRFVVGTLPMKQRRRAMIGLTPELVGLLNQAQHEAGQDSPVKQRLQRLRHSVETMARASEV